MSLQEGFKLSKASPEEMPEVWGVLEIAFADDEVWAYVIKDCKKEEVLPWILSTLGARYLMPDIETYTIKEESSGKIVGFTALAFPWKDRPAMTEELKALALSQDLPPMIEGMTQEGLVELFTVLLYAGNLGYDVEKDFHRKGTMILPEYQRRGFGRILTRHCNAIADAAGEKTWVPAREKSVNMFKTEGFKEIATRDSHMERFGGSTESLTWYLLREPEA